MQLTHKMLSHPDKIDNGIAPCYLVESRKMVGREDKLRDELCEHDVITSEFIGASVQECRDWAMKAWENRNGYISTEYFFIADERSGKDDTLFMQFWPPENTHNLLSVNCPPYGRLPKRLEWYEYRIEFNQSWYVGIHLKFMDANVPHFLYEGRKDEFTNEAGVFDVARIERMFKNNEKVDPGAG
jgi:hypothetical protein